MILLVFNAGVKHARDDVIFMLHFSQSMLVSPSDDVFDQLRQHLQEKICDGNGETLFDVGVGAGECHCTFSEISENTS